MNSQLYTKRSFKCQMLIVRNIYNDTIFKATVSILKTHNFDKHRWQTLMFLFIIIIDLKRNLMKPKYSSYL